jgi:hypothetical protein
MEPNAFEAKYTDSYHIFIEITDYVESYEYDDEAR